MLLVFYDSWRTDTVKKKAVHARERAREGFAVAKGKTGFRLFICSRYPVFVIPVQSRLVLEVQVLLEVAVVPLY
mgnify:CR=1 FL=1